MLLFFFFCEMQEKRKIPVFPNGSAPSSGDAPKEAAHHAGPELQRTGRWVQTLLPCGCLLGVETDVMDKAETCFCFPSVWKLSLSSIFPYFKKKVYCFHRYIMLRIITMHLKIVY